MERSGLCHFKALNLFFLNTVLNTECSDFFGRYCIHGNINFILEISSSAHFKDNFTLIKDRIGTIPLNLIVSYLRGGGGNILNGQ